MMLGIMTIAIVTIRAKINRTTQIGVEVVRALYAFFLDRNEWYL
jgi:hypothetical protein